MVPYLVLASFPVVFGLFYSYGKRKGINSDDNIRKTFLIICGIVLFIMIALRSKDIGSTDSNNYYNNWAMIRDASYKGLDDLIEDSRMETGYIITIWILTRVLKDPQILFILTGLLFTVAVCRFIYKNCEDVMVGFLMYVTLGLYTFMVQGLRQAIAMSICLFSVELLKKRKLIPFILVVLFASVYHQTAVIFLIAYLLYRLKMNSTGYSIATVASVIFIGAGNLFVGTANNFFERDYHGRETSGGIIALVIYIIILFVAVLFGGEKKKDKNFSFFFYFTWFGFIMFLMRYTEVLIVERISFYFAFGQIPVLTSVVQNLKSHEKVIIKYVLVILCVVLFAFRLSSSDLVPYKFFWQ